MKMDSDIYNEWLNIFKKKDFDKWSDWSGPQPINFPALNRMPPLPVDIKSILHIWEYHYVNKKRRRNSI
jgi:hypothetical protein